MQAIYFVSGPSARGIENREIAVEMGEFTDNEYLTFIHSKWAWAASKIAKEQYGYNSISRIEFKRLN